MVGCGYRNCGGGARESSSGKGGRGYVPALAVQPTLSIWLTGAVAQRRFLARTLIHHVGAGWGVGQRDRHDAASESLRHLSNGVEWGNSGCHPWLPIVGKSCSSTQPAAVRSSEFSDGYIQKFNAPSERKFAKGQKWHQILSSFRIVICT